jgi:hypothetical protein
MEGELERGAVERGNLREKAIIFEKDRTHSFLLSMVWEKCWQGESWKGKSSRGLWGEELDRRETSGRKAFVF